ncbi:MFS transporter [Actinomadura rudentiformis]|uniref:MFS transporter n=1 Tax=Actinomadura rudentiformis TaxID=359158 RepID=A0A6H9YNH4_9ACTN|nr:MFS transporter [Actinomadura rudentiformis]KAB2340416.1 MFS transporter [Actinomadura rudentiformis]
MRTERRHSAVFSPAVFCLAVSAFVMGTAEFVITGLLPEVAADLGVSLAAAGTLISAYALAIVVGGPVFVATGTRLPRRSLLLAAAAVFVLGNVIGALAPNYPVLLAGRVFSALGQGAFLPIAAVVAAELVDPRHRSRAIAVVFAGGTVANVVGAPLGTLLGQQLGWRATFWAVVGLAMGALVLIRATLPVSPPPATPPTLRNELAAFGRAQVWFTLAIGMAAFGGLFAMLTYVTPLLTSVSEFPRTAVAPLLALFGLGLLAGNTLGGWAGGRAQMRALGIALAVLAIGLATLALGASHPLLTAMALPLAGAAAFAVVAPFLTRLVDQAVEAPLLATAAGGSAVNLGAAVGAHLGGMSLPGLGYDGPPAVGAVIASAGLLVVAVAAVHARHAPDRSGTPVGPPVVPVHTARD